MSPQTTIRLTDYRIPEILQKLPLALDTIVQETALEIQGDAQESMSGEKHGRLYRGKAITVGAKGKRGRGMMAAGMRARNGRVTVGYKVRRASAPGEAPAIDTGNLVNSLETRKTGVGSAVVEAGAEYAAALEFGTRKMAPRPFLRPAADRAWAKFLEALSGLEAMLK